jgi:hypothetical protein
MWWHMWWRFHGISLWWAFYLVMKVIDLCFLAWDCAIVLTLQIVSCCKPMEKVHKSGIKLTQIRFYHVKINYTRYNKAKNLYTIYMHLVTTIGYCDNTLFVSTICVNRDIKLHLCCSEIIQCCFLRFASKTILAFVHYSCCGHKLLHIGLTTS